MIIDDNVPVLEGTSNRAVYSRLDPKLVWVNLLEKVFAKVKGSYHAIEAGYAHEALSTFTLAPCLNHYISTDPTPE